mmetsp:Transcript_33233/g.40761  ORF Transcript_33233/g.40761 Transcript_33233/m.40761 type:complete len:153 (-) Transcript_33233:145-603(-)
MMVSVDDTSLRGSGSALKTTIWENARSTIEEWTGGQDISPTSMYGIRVYQEGAVLVPHLDRLPLVASAMVNVAQDVDEDWPIEIYDHDGVAHNVTLAPGDMLLFESHSTIHGEFGFAFVRETRNAHDIPIFSSVLEYAVLLQRILALTIFSL